MPINNHSSNSRPPETFITCSSQAEDGDQREADYLADDNIVVYDGIYSFQPEDGTNIYDIVIFAIHIIYIYIYSLRYLLVEITNSYFVNMYSWKFLLMQALLSIKQRNTKQLTN